MNHIDETLVSLKDIEGVRGSFLFTRTGAVIAEDLPSVFSYDVLAEASLRTARLWETLGEVDRTIDSCILRYREHKLYLRPVVQGLLCVLSPPEVNMPALRMAVNLVVKRLNRLLVDVDLSALQQNARAATPPPSSSRMPPSSSYGVTPRSMPAHYAGSAAAAPAALAPETSDPSSSRRLRVYRGRRYEV